MTELPPPDPLAIQLRDNVLEGARRIRADQALAQERAAEIALAQHLHKGGPETSLALETEWLRNRLVWLHEHPKKWWQPAQTNVAIEYSPK